jgi:type II secretory pathway pseudopilin PulG
MLRWLCVLAVTVAVIFAVVASAALPKLNMAREYAEETSALDAIGACNTAEVQYNSQFGRYARSLTELGPSAADARQGYKFALTGTPPGYAITAVPTSIRLRSFHSDQSLVIRESYGPKPATADSQEVSPRPRVGVLP